MKNANILGQFTDNTASLSHLVFIFSTVICEHIFGIHVHVLKFTFMSKGLKRNSLIVFFSK